MSGVEGTGDKPALPRTLQELGEKAITRHERRPATPKLKMTLEEGKWWFESPYREQDEDHWVALMFDAFGTRSQATFCCFMIQMSQLCSAEWDKESEAWHPDEDELTAAVQIVRSTKPRNEAEACLAAQMVAVHVMQMKLSAQTIKQGWMEPRSCAIAGKLARTYATLIETMARLKGKGSKQRITVKKFARHEHKHIHLHPGAIENGNQPHEPKDTRAPEIKKARKLETRASLPSADTHQQAMSVPSDERKETVQIARRRGEQEHLPVISTARTKREIGPWQPLRSGGALHACYVS